MREWRTEMTKNAMGGTEILMTRLMEEFGDDLDQFQIIPSRVTELEPDKIRVLWLHDLGEDPMNNHLANGGWEKFHKIVFVSYLQREDYLLRYGIPPSRTTVMHNSIVPIAGVDIDDKIASNNPINLVYHTTPHRGLALLVPVFAKLAETQKDIHLHVYSSFNIYGWGERDKQFEPLFEAIKEHEQMTYYGAVPNDEVRLALKDMHIFAYPSIWKETSSLCLMEAMSAGCLCVHSTLGALPETAAGWSLMYDYHEDVNAHANRFYAVLDHAIGMIRSGTGTSELKSQKSYTDLFNSWDLRKMQWHDMLHNLANEFKDQNLGLPEEKFSYSAM